MHRGGEKDLYLAAVRGCFHALERAAWARPEGTDRSHVHLHCLADGAAYEERGQTFHIL